MKLDYFTLLCPEPIRLSIGNIRQPKLREIGKLTYPIFNLYQVYLKLTPQDYYTLLNKEQGEEIWNSLSDEVKEKMTMFDIILTEESIRNIYLKIFNFFFVERVVFLESFFFIVNTDDYETPPEELNLEENTVGVISQDTFLEVLNIIQQVCCINSNEPTDDQKPKFKNKKAERIYEKIQKAEEERKKAQVKKDAPNMTLANIISAVAAKSTGLNIVNIWDATLFQVYDQFGKLQNDNAHYMNSVRVAVWGDENNQFDPTLWYKNNFDKKSILDF